MLSLMSEASGFDEEPGFLSEAPTGLCSRDACISVIRKGDREWRLLATRSFQRIDWAPLVQACRDADIVVSDSGCPAVARRAGSSSTGGRSKQLAGSLSI